jgi:hypothetical protein
VELTMGRTGIDWSVVLATDPPAVGPVDPYFVWADLTNFRGYLRGPVTATTKVPFLVESTQGAVPFAREFVQLNAIKAQLIDEQKILRWQFGQAREPRSGLEIESAPRPKNQTKVLAAVLDDGCPMFNAALQRGAGTSVQWLWHQGGQLGPATPPGTWVNPATLGHSGLYGAELRPETIASLASSTTLSEAKKYAALAYLADANIASPDPWKPRYHGAGVLSQVSGNPSPASRLAGLAVPVNDATWPTIFVQFPPRDVGDTTGAWLGLRVFEGLNYVLNRAEIGFELTEGGNEDVSIVACISYGGLAGPHDGSTMLERAMLALLNASNHLQIVVPAGNAFDRSIHAVGKPTPQHPAHYSVFVAPDNPNPVFVEFWLPERIDCAAVSATLTPPSGAPTGQLTVNGPSATVGTALDCGIVFAQRVAQGTSGTMLLVAIQPTRAISGSRAPAGVWTVELTAPTCDVHAWIERDDITGRLPRAQQARFVQPADGVANFAQIVETETLSSIANAVHPRFHVAGARYAVPVGTESASPYSASGPSIGGGRVGPDYSAIADASPTLPGVVVGGARSGEFNRASGTSIAAAITARHLLVIAAAPPGPPGSSALAPRPTARIGALIP